MEHDKTPIALITGASSGLGEAFAYNLANKGFNLILMARRLDRLETIQSNVSVPCQLFQIDLGQLDQVKTMIKKLPPSIDLLICNAGYRIGESFEDAQDETISQQINSMIESHNMLIKHYLPIFKENKHGDIIMVSSIAGLLPSPGALYGPIKAYQHHQAINFHAHYNRFGIHCMSLCPGLVKTEFHTANGPTDWSNIASRWWMDANSVAEKTMQKLSKRKTFFIPGWYNQLMYSLLRHFPVKVQQKCVQWFFEKSKI